MLAQPRGLLPRLGGGYAKSDEKGRSLLLLARAFVGRRGKRGRGGREGSDVSAMDFGLEQEGMMGLIEK